MKKVLAILMLLCTSAAAQNYLRDDGVFHSVVEGTTTGQLLQNQSGLLGGISLPLPLVIGTTPITGTPLTGVLYNNSGFLGASSVFTFTPTTGVTLAPAAASNNPALTITQSTPNSGSVAGPILLNSITVTDNAQTVTGSGLDAWGQIKNQTNVLRLNLTVTGGSANHFGGNFAANVTGTNGGTVPLLSSCYVNVGTITGDCWANIAVGNVGPTGNLNQSLIGYEAELLVATAGAVKDRIAFSCNSQGPVTATGIDACIVANLYTVNSSPYNGAAAWGNFIYLSNNLYLANAQPIATGGSVIKADTATMLSLFNGPTVTFTGNILDAVNLKINGAGGMLLGGGSTAAPTNGLRVVASPGNAGALQIGATLSGSTITNPAFNVDNSTVNAVTGVYINSDIAGNGAQILTTSSATNEALKLNAKGSGTLDLAGTSTGGVTVHGSFTATGLVTNADLANAATTVNGQTCTLGSTCTVTATATSTLTFGTHLTSGGASYNGSAPITITSDAASANTASTIVARDASNNFAAGTITASLTGHASLDLALTGGTMSGGIAMGTNSITGLVSLSAVGAMTFSSNNGTLAGTITTGQKWGIGLETNPQSLLVVSANSTTGIATPAGTVIALNGADATSTVFAFQSFGTGQNPTVLMRAANGTAASPSASQAGDVLGFYSAKGYAATAYDTAVQSGMYVGALNTHTLADNTTFIAFLNVTSGTTRAETARIQSGLSVGTTVDPGAGAILANTSIKATTTLTVAGIANVATTSAVCVNTGTGLFTYDGTLGTCTVSDERLKNMGERIPNALERLLKINGVYYTWKDPDSMGKGRQIGVGAQTVEAVFPELVQADSSGYKSADYMRLTAPIIEAMRELKVDNDNLNAEVQSLKRGTR